MTLMDMSPWFSTAVPNLAALQSLLQSNGQMIGAKILVLDASLNPVTANLFAGRAANDISPACTLKSVTNDSTQDVSRTADIEIRESELGSFALSALNHRLQVYLEWYDGTFDQYGNPHAILSVCVGTFRAMFPDRNLTTGTDIAIWQNASWHDLAQDLANLIYWNVWDVAAGSVATTVVKTICQTDKLPPSQGGRISPNPALTPAGCDFLGPNYTAQQLAGLWPASAYPSLSALSGIQSSALTTPVATSWDYKVNVYGGLKDLLGSIGFYPLWNDPMGGLATRQRNYYKTAVPNSVWSFTVGSAAGPTETSIIKTIIQRYNGLDQVKNAVRGLSTPNAGTPIVWEALNTSASSSVNISAVGGIPYVFEDNTIPDLATMQFRVNLELQSRAMVAEQLEVTGGVVPWCLTETHGVVDMDVWTWQGVHEIGSGSYPYEIQRCQVDLSNPAQPTQTMLLSRAVPV